MSRLLPLVLCLIVGVSTAAIDTASNVVGSGAARVDVPANETEVHVEPLVSSAEPQTPHRPQFPNFFDIDRETQETHRRPQEEGDELVRTEHGVFDAAAHRRRAAAELSTPTQSCDLSDPLSCGSHGRCFEGTRCICYQNITMGFWTGTASNHKCEACQQGWAGTGCMIECEGGSCDRCSGHGTCNEGTTGDGTCTCDESPATGYWATKSCSACKTSYYGLRCDESCPGTNVGQAVCFGRGTCTNDGYGSGTCTCIEGWGADTGCQECDDAHFGATCLAKCNGYVELTNTPCSGHGKCSNGTTGDGLCECDFGWGSFDCSRHCPSNPDVPNRCSGHGTCLWGANQDASCRCSPNFEIPDCAECTANRTGNDCELTCPINEDTGRICSGRGTCMADYGPAVPRAVCHCVPGYYSGAGNTTCEQQCPGSPPCSGHGSCRISHSGDPVCECFSDGAKGFWDGALCDRCAESHNRSAGCLGRCPTATGGICNGHGECADGACFCGRDSFYVYCGDSCQNSASVSCTSSSCGCPFCSKSWEWGTFCHSDCAGFVPATSTTDALACKGHGLCFNGKDGNGTCRCLDGYAGKSCGTQCDVGLFGLRCSGPGRGRCVTTPIGETSPPSEEHAHCECSPQFAGARCEIECPTIGGLVCTGHGVCSRNNGSLVLGTGECSCSAGWTGRGCSVPCACDSAHGQCDLSVCADFTSYQTCTACQCTGNFSAPGLCKDCIPGTQGNDCTGACVNGNTVGRSCECKPNWSTASCDVFCPVDVHNDICGGHGQCVANAKVTASCDCEPKGAPTWFRANCTKFCTVAGCTGVLVNPQCNPLTGDCECKDDADGHWSGSNCDVCKLGFWGAECTEACQCNNHGSCDKNNGECTCFQNAANGFYTGAACEACSAGYIGENCEQKNVFITRLPAGDTSSQSGAASDNHLPPDIVAFYGTESAVPAPAVLAVDEYSHTMYAGDVPTFKYDILGMNFSEVTQTLLNGTNLTKAIPGSTNISSAKCNDEMAHIRPHQDDLYYVMQPSEWCDTPLRILIDLKRREPSAPIDVDAKNMWWSWTLNRTIRARAVASTGDKYYYGSGGIDGGTPLGIVILATQFSGKGGTGAQFPGGFVFYVSGTNKKSDFKMMTLPDGFLAHDVSIDKPEQLTSPQSITVSGTFQNRWELLVFYLDDNKDFVPKYGPEAHLSTGYPSLFNELKCWPTFAGDPIAKCVDCINIQKVEFFNHAVVAVMQGLDVNRQSIMSLAWVRPIAQVAEGEIVAALIGGGCVSARFEKSKNRLVSVSTGATTLVLPELVVMVARTSEKDVGASSLAIDHVASVAYICLRYLSTTSSQPSVVAKFSLNAAQFSVYGKRELDYVPTVTKQSKPEVFSQLAIDSDARIMYGLVTGIYNLRIVRFLLYEVRSVNPNIIDQRGGTVNVTGLGFQAVDVDRGVDSTKYPIRCQFGGVGETVEATNVTFTSVVCQITEVDNATTSSCDGQTVEVSLYTDLRFTQTLVAVTRIKSALISPPVVPDRGPLSGGQVITVNGQSFVDSPYAVCKFYSENAEVLLSKLTFVNPNQATCRQPLALLPSTGKSYLDVSLDGQSYTEAGPAEYQIVGAATNLSSPVTQQERAVTNTTMSAAVYVVDDQGHRLLALDAVNRTVCLWPNVTVLSTCDVSTFSWWAAHGFTFAPCRNNTLNVTDGEFCKTAVNGEIVFDNIVFYEARASVFDVAWYIEGHPWTTTTRLTIVEGDAVSLAIENRHSFVLDPTFKNDVALKPMDIVVVDALGNVLTAPADTIIVTARPYYIMDSNNEVVVSTSQPTAQLKPGNNKVVFESIIMKFVHGADHFVNITSQNPVLTGTTSPTLRTVPCANPTLFFKQPNTSLCLPCPAAGAVCDGSETIVVKPGYWRGNTTTFIYLCPAGETVCLGSPNNTGSICAEGYTGELCGVCSGGYGKVGSKSCSPCEATWINSIIVAVAGAIFLGGLLAWSSISLRTAEVTDVSVILRTVLNHLQATGKLGEFSTQWNPFLKSLFDIQSSGSSLSISGLSAVDCLLRTTGNDALTIFIIYMSLPLIAVVMAFGVFVVVRILQLEPIISDDLRNEIMEDIKNFGTPSTMQLLYQYPFYMVVTTTLSVILFASYQTLITQSTTVLQCTSLMVADGDERSFLESDMSVNCASGRYNSFRTVALLCACGYGLGIPMMFVFGYNFVNGRIGKPALTEMMFLFLTGGYKASYWFWQAIIMIRKLALVLIVVFIQNNAQLQSYCGMWIMSVALVIQIWFSPNEKDEHNLVEALSLAIITITLNLGLLYFWTDMPVAGKDALTAILIIITFGAVCMFVYFLYGPVKDVIIENFHLAKEVATDIQQKATTLRQGQDEKRKTLRGLVLREEEEDDHDHDLEHVAVGPGGAGLRIRGSGRHRDKTTQPNFFEVEMDSFSLGSPRSQPGLGSPASRGSFRSPDLGSSQLHGRRSVQGRRSGPRPEVSFVELDELPQREEVSEYDLL